MTKCSIIQDLLTIYVGGTCCADTCELVDEHIKMCDECQGKLTELQDRVAAVLRENNAKGVNVFKTMKKRIFRRNVLVSLYSIVAVIAIVVGVFHWVLLPQTPISYEDGLLQLHVNIAKVAYDQDGHLMIITDPNEAVATYEEREVLDIVSSRKTANRSIAYINIEENGESVRLAFVNFTESLLSKLEPGGETAYAVRIIEPQDTMTLLAENGEEIVWEVFDRVEVYYINQVISEINAENDYAKLRKDGVLIWSGTLE